MNIFIIGSCVTRDAFTSRLLDRDFNLVGYAARTSLARFVSGSKFVKSDEINLKSAFQKRMIANDISNYLLSSVQELKNIDMDFLIVDVVDDRFGLVEYKDIYINNSDELRISRLIDTKNASKIISNSEEYKKRWEAGLLELLNYIPKEKVIINDVHWARETELGQNVSTPERIAFCESVIGSLYNIAKQHIPKENFVDYPQGIFIADSNHKWGKSPFHYVQPVYDYLIRFLQNRFALME